MNNDPLALKKLIVKTSELFLPFKSSKKISGTVSDNKHNRNADRLRNFTKIPLNN